MNKKTVEVGALYQHYKNRKLYKILALAFNAESDQLEYWVVYQALYDDQKLGSQPIFIRSICQFTQQIEVDGREFCRFQLVESGSTGTPRALSSEI